MKVSKGKRVVWGVESGRIVKRDGNMVEIKLTDWNVTLWVRIEHLRLA